MFKRLIQTTLPLTLAAVVAGAASLHTNGAAGQAEHLPAQSILQKALEAVRHHGSITYTEALNGKASSAPFLPGYFHWRLKGEYSPIGAGSLRLKGILWGSFKQHQGPKPHTHWQSAGAVLVQMKDTNEIWEVGAPPVDTSCTGPVSMSPLHYAFSLLAPKNLLWQHLRFVGATTFHGEPAWHIRSITGAKDFEKLEAPRYHGDTYESYDLIIRQSDFRFLRVDSTYTEYQGPNDWAQDYFSAANFAFGGALKLRMPKSCPKRATS